MRDSVCPFCGASVALRVRAPVRGRLCRFAIMTGILAASACSGTPENDGGPDEQDAGPVVMPYGAPAFAAYV